MGCYDSIIKHIHNNYTTIDIHNLVEFPGWLFKLIEDSEEIHFVEGCNALFYFCQYKNIINLTTKIVNFHIWARNRKWIEYKLDESWTMMSTPKLNNWNYIF
jgi:hypothetical protein